MLTTSDKLSTAGASSPDAVATVRLWPYAPGVYGRDALYRVWKLMEDDGATVQAFWDDQMACDLASFIKTFDGAPNKVLLLIERTDTGHLCGCFWVTQITPGHQAFVGMWMHSEARGALSVEAAKKALAYTFDAGGFRQLWALTPWHRAGALCRRTGFRAVAQLPQFTNDRRDVTVYRLTKEAFHGHVW